MISVYWAEIIGSAAAGSAGPVPPPLGGEGGLVAVNSEHCGMSDRKMVGSCSIPCVFRDIGGCMGKSVFESAVVRSINTLR